MFVFLTKGGLSAESLRTLRGVFYTIYFELGRIKIKVPV